MMETVQLDEDTLDLILTKLARYALSKQLENKRQSVCRAVTPWTCLLCDHGEVHPTRPAPILCALHERTLAAISLRDITIEPTEEPKE